MSAWATLPLGQVVTFQRGFDLPHRARNSGEIPIVSSAGVTDFHDVAMVDAPGVVTGRYGTIGEIFLISEPFWPLNTTLYVRDFHGNDPRFIYYHLQKFDFTSFSGKSGVPGVNRNDLHVETVTLPTDPAEQLAISAALSDVDALLDGLNRLIAKKRDLKRTAMQQLLTGRTRLPGFDGEWEVRRLGDHVVFMRNGVNSRAELLPEGRVRYLHYGDIHASKDVYLSAALLPCLPDTKATSLDRLKDGDLIFADASEDAAGVGKSVELKEVGSTEVVSGLHTIAARFDKKVVADGFKGFLQFCPPFASSFGASPQGPKFMRPIVHISQVL